MTTEHFCKFQYKDAFFNAHPDFKWYKLPAPPLRTLSSRPRDATDKQTDSHHEPDTELEKTNNNSTKLDFNKELELDPKPLSMFTPGKLADEAQMGGLSSLLATKTDTLNANPYYSPPSYKFNTISTPTDFRSHLKGSREDNIRELQNALSETTRVFEEDFDEKERLYRYNQNDQFTNQDVIDQIVDKRYSNDDYGYQRNWSDDEKNTRSGRSCKGKRYQEFMAIGGLIANKRQKREMSDKPDEAYNATCSWDTSSLKGEDTSSTTTDESKISHQDPTENDLKMEQDAPETDNITTKTFKAADFDLDAKIRALPSLSLEKFQQKKRENKRKKKTVNLRPKPLENQIINSVPRPVYDERREMIESWRETVIGSQKRKPRKISITRLEVNSMVSSIEDKRKISPEIKIATEAPRNVGQTPHGVELLALATLAEVASNTSKLEDSASLAALTDHASKV